MSKNLISSPSITSKTTRYGSTVQVLEYEDGRKVHIDDDGHVYDWMEGYESYCHEFTNIDIFNDLPDYDVFSGMVDPETHLRQGNGTRRFFNDPDVFFLSSKERNKHLPYMYRGDFLNGAMHGTGEMQFNDGSVLNGTWENNYIVQNKPCVFMSWVNGYHQYEGLANDRLLSLASDYVRALFDDEEETLDEGLLKRKSMRES